MTRRYGQLLDIATGALHQVLGQHPQTGPIIGPVTALLTFIAADVDNHVAHRLRQNEQLRHLLQRARDLVPADHAKDIDAALAATQVGAQAFSVPNVEADFSRLKQDLIAVHTWLETPDGSHHRELLDDIWAFCKADTTHASRMEKNLW